MIGEVKIYKTYNNSEELIHSENNIIVDGMKEYFADVMSYFPSPSALSGSLSGYYAASSFGIKAWSLGPQRGKFLTENAWDGVSGYGTTYSTPSSPSSVLSSLDETKGHHLLPYPANNKLIGTNFKDNYYYNTGSPANALLINHNFSSVYNNLRNPSFDGPKLDLTLSGSVFNEILGLYEVPLWDTSSTLRYFVSSSEFSSNGDYGSLSVVAASATAFSSTEASSSNLLHIRSFATSANPDTSGAVHISQATVLPKNAFSPFAGVDALLNPLGILEFQTLSLSANGSTNIIALLKDETTDEVYDFTKNTWSSTNTISRKWTGVDASPTLKSLVFNMPAEKLNNKLRVTFSFYASATGDVFETYITEPVVGYMEGWKYGTVVSGDYVGRKSASGGVSVFKNGAYGGSGTAADLWSTQTMLVQSFSGLYPDRAYYQRADVSSLVSGKDYKIRTSLVASDNIFDTYKYDASQDTSFSGFKSTTSTERVQSPLGHNVNKYSYPLSHRCVKLDNFSSLSATGTFSIGKSYKLEAQTWDGYDKIISNCGIESAPSTGHINARLKVSKLRTTSTPNPLEDLYWDSTANDWTDVSSSFFSLKGTKTGFNKKSEIVRMVPALQDYCDENNNLSITLTFSATEGDAFFKDFEFVAGRTDISDTTFISAHQTNSTTNVVWSGVSNSDLSANLSSLPYQQTQIDSVADTTVSYGAAANFLVYYEDLQQNHLYTPRKDNECKYVFRVVDGPNIPTALRVLHVNSIGMGDAGTIFLSSNSYTADKVTSERGRGWSF